MENKEKFTKGIFYLLLFFAVIIAGALLKIMGGVIKPLLISVLLAFIFYPFVKKLSLKYKFPWWLSTALVYIFVSVIVFFFVNLLSSSLKSVVLVLPKYEERFIDLQKTFLQYFSADPESKLYSLFDFDEEASLLANINSQLNVLEFIKKAAIDFTGSVVNFMKTFFLVLLFSIFLLAELKNMRQKVNRAFDGEGAARIFSILHNIVSDVTHYISIKFVTSLVTGICVFVTGLCFGLDFPLIWGFLAFCLNFIPTFGSIISCGLMILFAVIQFYPSFWTVFFIAVLVIAVNFVLGNVLEPKIEGENLGVSPFIILVSLSLWGWIWGILGMILAVPFVVIVKIICENVSYLKPVAVFLGGSKHSC